MSLKTIDKIPTFVVSDALFWETVIYWQWICRKKIFGASTEDLRQFNSKPSLKQYVKKMC